MAYTTIDDPSLYFRVKTYSGSSSDGNAITWDETDTNMSPNFLWLKNRTSAQEHWLCDTVRGTGKFLESNSSNAESSDGASGFASFDSNGFTLNDSARTNRNTMVAWGWKASGSTASNTNGTNITSTVDANTTSGFSIVSWTGDNSGSSTVGHGLGKTAEFVVIKNRADSANWQVKHKNNSANASQSLDAEDAESSRAGSTNGGIADLSGTTTFGFIAGSAGVPAANGASDAMIAYVWNSVQGFSKFGKYTGNGNADNTFVYTGMKISYLLIKAIGSSNSWQLFDNKRDGYNPDNNRLYSDSSTTESTTDVIDFLSNGFKVRDTNTWLGSSGATFIYMAFAEAPFVNSKGVPANAR